MIVTCTAMRELEARAFAEGITPSELMEDAGQKIARAVTQFFPEPGRCIAVFGKGHNGGDALVAARWLAKSGWNITLWQPFPAEECAPLTQEKLRELEACELEKDRLITGATIILDGLLGIGAKGPLRAPIVDFTRRINQARIDDGAFIFALDLPSGLDGDTGQADPDAVIADVTLSIGFAKPGLLADRATNLVGRLAVLPLPALRERMPESEGSPQVATACHLAPLLPRRRFDIHKGDCGRVGIIAGSPGMVGAAVMAAEACVHAGAGLVTLYVCADTHPLISGRCALEVMVQSVKSFAEALDHPHDALAIGPGLGSTRRAEIFSVLEHAKSPLIVDADALNALATRIEVLSRSAGPRLLTPHPGEMARLDPASTGPPRNEAVTRFVSRFPSTLLLKGSRTVVGERGRPLSYNTTGTPGMASGGMGDVLTGVLAALVGQGLALYDAARLGAWLCGRSAERALQSGESEESLAATHVIAQLGAAFHDLRDGQL